MKGALSLQSPRPSMRVPHLLTQRHIAAASSRCIAAATPSVDSSPAIGVIFDAPFGMSSTHPGHSSSQVVDSERAKQQTIPSLPEPILYDGPSQTIKSRSICTSANILPTSLPPPEIFDGPARPRLLHRLRADASESVPRHVTRSRRVVFLLMIFQGRTLGDPHASFDHL
jgi:hypothetical protein